MTEFAAAVLRIRAGVEAGETAEEDADARLKAYGESFKAKKRKQER